MPMVAFTIGTALHGFWCYLYIDYYDYGVVGGGMAMATTFIFIYTFLTLHSHCIPEIRKALFWPTADSFTGWGEYLSISTPATIMMCAEWWAFEVLIIFAGYISVEAQASQVLVLLISNFVFNFAKGMSEATGSLIGNQIGDNKVDIAKTICKVTFFVAGIGILIVACILFAVRVQVASLFTQEEELIEAVSGIIPILAL